MKTESAAEKDEGISSSNNIDGEGISADSGKVYIIVRRRIILHLNLKGPTVESEQERMRY